VVKIAEKAVCKSVFLTTYFECRINRKRTHSYCFFGDFAHWVGKLITTLLLQEVKNNVI